MGDALVSRDSGASWPYRLTAQGGTGQTERAGQAGHIVWHGTSSLARYARQMQHFQPSSLPPVGVQHDPAAGDRPLAAATTPSCVSPLPAPDIDTGITQIAHASDPRCWLRPHQLQHRECSSARSPGQLSSVVIACLMGAPLGWPSRSLAGRMPLLPAIPYHTAPT
jgi:hypothetical protein